MWLCPDYVDNSSVLTSLSSQAGHRSAFSMMGYCFMLPVQVLSSIGQYIYILFVSRGAGKGDFSGRTCIRYWTRPVVTVRPLVVVVCWILSLKNGMGFGISSYKWLRYRGLGFLLTYRTSMSPTEWVDLPERAAGLWLAPVIRPSTRTGREQTCSSWHTSLSALLHGWCMVSMLNWVLFLV